MSTRMGPRKRRIRVEILLERDGTRCTWCCREMLDLPIEPRQDCRLHMTLEHLKPVSLGGSHDLINLALACFECNNARGDLWVAFEPDWAVELGV